jgi:hypothetical protein
MPGIIGRTGCSRSSLDPALLVYAEDERAVRQREIQTDDVAHLVDEQRVAGSLDSLNVSDRCGCSPKAVQIRRIVV